MLDVILCLSYDRAHHTYIDGVPVTVVRVLTVLRVLPVEENIIFEGRPEHRIRTQRCDHLLSEWVATEPTVVWTTRPTLDEAKCAQHYGTLNLIRGKTTDYRTLLRWRRKKT